MVRHDLPRRESRGMSETFSADPGLIPTAMQERARLIAALSGEVEKKLRMVPGVADAHVTVVLPEDDPLRDVDALAERATASVVYRYLVKSEAGEKPPLDEGDCRSLVAASIPGLSPNDVVVVARPAIADVFEKVEGDPTVSFLGVRVHPSSRGRFRAVVFGLLGVSSELSRLGSRGDATATRGVGVSDPARDAALVWAVGTRGGLNHLEGLPPERTEQLSEAVQKVLDLPREQRAAFAGREARRLSASRLRRGLEGIDPSWIVEALRGEEPHVVAAALVYLPTPVRRTVVKLLPRKVREAMPDRKTTASVEQLWLVRCRDNRPPYSDAASGPSARRTDRCGGAGASSACAGPGRGGAWLVPSRPLSARSLYRHDGARGPSLGARGAESSRHDGRRSRGACRAVLGGAAQASIKRQTISTCGQGFGSSHMF